MTFVPHIFFYIIWWLNWKRILLFRSHYVMIDKKKTPKEREENEDQRIH
ncbi:hypothetical protein HMPREF9521_00161 [Enterococcus faecalis TX2134]|nr:hypothetical protein HMPREF9521_00161 [Enterococcus faecalis TX2134]